MEFYSSVKSYEVIKFGVDLEIIATNKVPQTHKNILSHMYILVFGD